MKQFIPMMEKQSWLSLYLACPIWLMLSSKSPDVFKKLEDSLVTAVGMTTIKLCHLYVNTPDIHIICLS